MVVIAVVVYITFHKGLDLENDAGIEYNDKKLDEKTILPLMALLIYLYVSVNSMAYYAFTTYRQFGVIVERLGNILGMDQFEYKRPTN